MVQKTLQDMVEAMDYPPDVAKAVLDHIDELGTADAIVAGERTLPHPQDAQRWYENMQREYEELEKKVGKKAKK